MSKTIHIRTAAANFEWPEVDKHLHILFLNIDFCIIASIIRKQLENSLGAVQEETEDINWIPDLLHVLSNCKNLQISELKSFPFYGEAPDFDNNTFINSVITINIAHIDYLNGNTDEAIAQLISSLTMFMIFLRYRFWTQQQPQLEPFWHEDSDSAENFLARLSFGKDPIINAYIRDSWFAICDEIDKALQ